MNNTGVTGLTAKKDFEHARGLHVIPPMQLIRHTTDIRHTDNINIYVSRKISIVHPSVGLALLAQLAPINSWLHTLQDDHTHFLV